MFQSEDGRTALHMTALHGRFTRAQTLIEHGEVLPPLLIFVINNPSVCLHCPYGSKLLVRARKGVGISLHGCNMHDCTCLCVQTGTSSV